MVAKDEAGEGKGGTDRRSMGEQSIWGGAKVRREEDSERGSQEGDGKVNEANDG